jgi:hypothetical protein
MLAGEALRQALYEAGIQLVRVNYEELGNWAYKESDPKPELHLHIFGRVKDAVVQKFPEAIKLPSYESGFYQDFEPLSVSDMELIKNHIEQLVTTPKYDLKNWEIIK